MTDTIFAEATAPGRAGIAVIRSGPGAFVAGRVLGARRAVLRRLRDPGSGDLIDEAVLLAFPGPGSFTGEDVLEIQCHGSRAVVRTVLDRLGAVPGLRLAEPGEFTRRALENGRLDLAQVEGLADLVAAETEAQRRQAVAVMGGALSRLAEGWREGIVEALARVEAAIDFADEDIPETVYAEADARLAPVARELAEQVRGAPAAERLREGFEVALVGAPNAGKSTLLNAIAGRSVAITSEHPGTTRDVIELRVDLRGLPVTFLDLAGIRETAHPVEAEGVARARARAAGADLRLVLDDGLGVVDEYATHYRKAISVSSARRISGAG
jgi:tRNA modification GTPase